MSIGKEKKKGTYSYYYPEQVELFKDLESGDVSYIARKVGKSRQYIDLVSKGKRKITPTVKKVVEKLTSLRKEISELEI
ncbi:MAG: hypothetical protein JEY96_16785 [Bacteroidales bacterium]|nr:hypothetical protein [Bacteroidales bacterium]